MTAFSWKRKVGNKTQKHPIFRSEAEDDSEGNLNLDSDWLTSIKRRKHSLEEDCQTKSSRLKTEGDFLAENGRYWEAIRKWDDAIQLTPHNEKLYEAKAQGLMQLCELFPAVQAAEKAVKLCPNWWVAHQTLGRAHLGIGEIRMAIQSFSKAFHLNPENMQLWDDDLQWALSLFRKQREMQMRRTVQELAQLESLNIVLDDNGEITDIKGDNLENHPEKWVKCRF